MSSAMMARVIGHRGAAGLAPENTMDAFEMAAGLGVKWVETDARIIKDGAVVLFHNDRLAYLRGLVSKCTASKAAAFGLIFLKDLLARAPELGLAVNIELKTDDYRDDAQGERLADAVADLIAGYEGPLLMSSFSPRALARIKERAPHVPRGLLFWQLPSDWLSLARDLDVRTIHTRWQKTRAADIAQITQNGYEAYVFTINEPKDAEPLWPAGLSGLFTAYPDRFLNQHI